MEDVSKSEIQLFDKETDACIEPRPDGTVAVNLDCLLAAVKRRPAAAVRAIRVHCLVAASTPGYLRQAALLAECYFQAYGDDKPRSIVLDRAKELGAEDQLRRLMYEARRPDSETRPERQAARAWWAQQPEGFRAQCDNCGEGLSYEQGFLITGRQARLGDTTIDMGEEIVCRRCFTTIDMELHGG